MCLPIMVNLYQAEPLDILYAVKNECRIITLLPDL